MSPDLNPIEHVWDFIGRRVRAREPPVQTLRQLEAALHQEWRQLTLEEVRRFTGNMRNRLRKYWSRQDDGCLFVSSHYINPECSSVSHTSPDFTDTQSYLEVYFEFNQQRNLFTEII
ncbi:hypothetical protein LOTGIDRAFT_233859 [Lottia gigantea]|uniref:Tc1-like transposase DDE domain-containing protein n=1 Tax=Lottia gigantea TaxID=225164 RepID=V4BNF6_LOTGI|nr:hypothetical protein LOTGIDRAFT_233859 [Lottia gigantea]ESO90379.1 hypothetical protein LOTGIDRAFT_233859 [Lottia gigantea]